MTKMMQAETMITHNLNAREAAALLLLAGEVFREAGLHADKMLPQAAKALHKRQLARYDDSGAFVLTSAGKAAARKLAAELAPAPVESPKTSPLVRVLGRDMRTVQAEAPVESPKTPSPARVDIAELDAAVVHDVLPAHLVGDVSGNHYVKPRQHC